MELKEQLVSAGENPVLDNLKAKLAEPNKNVPLTGKMIDPETGKPYTVKRDKEGKILPIHTSEQPNRAKRREEKQRGSHRNSKQKKGTHVQVVPVTHPVETTVGTIAVNTGYNRVIKHNSVEQKVADARLSHLSKAYAAQEVRNAVKSNDGQPVVPTAGTDPALTEDAGVGKQTDEKSVDDSGLE